MSAWPSPRRGPRCRASTIRRSTRISCGVGFIADIKGRKSQQLVADALAILCNLEHRGAVGADPRAGDGAGILMQIPHAFFAKEAARLGFTLPPPGEYAVGNLFMPRDPDWRQIIRDIYAQKIKQEGMTLIGWRDIPTDNSTLGESVKPTEPVHQQVFIGRGKKITSEDEFERRLYILRKWISSRIYMRRERRLSGYYPVSISCRTIVYKGMFLADQLGTYYPDLHDPDFVSALALVHQRFSTNTFPTWSLAHPYRMIAHNGEINTLRGNNNWMAARQASVSSPLFGDDIEKLWPISYEGQSDTACFDNALEFLTMGGYSLAHAMMMMIPEAWAGNPLMDEERRAFYEYNAALMEPWDGPAAIAFTDGRQIGATLDRNGLRPARYFVTRDDRIVMASEMGVLPIPEKDIVTKWRLQPGKMLLVDLAEGRLIPDEELKSTLAKSHPYKEWLERTQIVLEDLPAAPGEAPRSNLALLDRQQAFGYTQEDLRILMSPMALQGEEAIGSMGNDTPISALSDRPKLLFTYFKQNFAQVTNPPIDPIREELVMSLVSIIGPRPNLFDLEGLSRSKRLEVRQPILTNADLEKIRSISEVGDGHFKSRFLDTTWPAEQGADGLKDALDALCARAEAAVREGINIIILSDRRAGADRIPIASLLACAAVHHHLIRQGLRTSVGIVVESGEPREVHHFACLAGYGAEAINPYLAFETLVAMQDDLPVKLDENELVKRYIKSVGKGLLKVMSKMGISTYQSYCGAQIFDAIGLKSDFVAEYFTGTATRIEGVGLNQIAEECVRRHRNAFNDMPIYRDALDVGGEYQFRVRGEDHVWTAGTVSALQHAVRANLPDQYRAYAKVSNEQSERLLTIRGLFRLKAAEEDGRTPVPIEEVESAESIVKRFATGAMSFGSISREAHTTLAIAMNRIGGKSNTGEGGEESDRFKPLPNGDLMRSAIKQVASGRFGVTTEYLVNSDVMQIKMAQGAKPGEGGQLPGHKVDQTIAKVRHSTPGVGLISPPPHHDIYSIEDLAQLIFDLKNVNPDGARLGQAGVGSRRRHGGGRRLQGARRSRHHFGLRGRHRRLAAHLDQACRQPVGDRAGRNPSDAGRQPAARPHRRAGRRRHPHRPRRRRRRAARRRRVRLLDRAADRGRLHHDAQVPPQHLPGRGRDARPGAAQEVRRPARARHQLLLLRRRRGARDHGGDGLPHLLRDDRADSDARQAPGHRALEGEGPRFLQAVLQTARPGRCEHPQLRGAGSQSRPRARPPADRRVASGARPRRAGADRHRHPQHRPHRRRDAVGRDRQALRPRRPADRHHPREVLRHRRAELRRLARAWRHLRTRGRGQRLCRQGPLGRTHHRAAGRRLPASCRRNRSSSATPCCTARSRASATSAASPASASRCATPAPSRWSRARATIAANT